MATATETETHRAAKAHRCDWCNTPIGVGELYKRYRFYDGGDVGTVKMHPECHAAMGEAVTHEGGWLEWAPGENARGCNCGRTINCPKCNEIEKLHEQQS